MLPNTSYCHFTHPSLGLWPSPAWIPPSHVFILPMTGKAALEGYFCEYPVRLGWPGAVSRILLVFKDSTLPVIFSSACKKKKKKLVVKAGWILSEDLFPLSFCTCPLGNSHYYTQRAKMEQYGKLTGQMSLVLLNSVHCYDGFHTTSSELGYLWLGVIL